MTLARIVFDLDGTLVDSNPSLTAAGNALLGELGRMPVPEEACARFVGNGARALVQRLLAHSGGVPTEGVDPHLARFRQIYGADPVTGTRLHAGVREALAALSASGHGLAVCTQKPNAPAEAILHAFGLMPPISALTGGDSLDVLKPDPRMLAHAADQLPPGAVVYVGDSHVDAETAEAAGVPFLLYTEGYRLLPIDELRHAAAFSDFAELPALIESLLAAAAEA